MELVLGDGILSWRRPEGGIYHPVLLQRLQLEFSANVPEFTLAETEVPVELYSALFQSMSDVDGRVIGRCREELEQGSNVGNFRFKRIFVQPGAWVRKASAASSHFKSCASLMFVGQGRREEGWVVGADIKADIYADVVAL